MVQILTPLAGPRVAEALRKTVSEMFGVWSQALAAGFAKYTMPDGSLPPRLSVHLPLDRAGSIGNQTPFHAEHPCG